MPAYEVLVEDKLDRYYRFFSPSLLLFSLFRERTTSHTRAQTYTHTCYTDSKQKCSTILSSAYLVSFSKVAVLMQCAEDRALLSIVTRVTRGHNNYRETTIQLWLDISDALGCAASIVVLLRKAFVLSTLNVSSLTPYSGHAGVKDAGGLEILYRRSAHLPRYQ